MLTGGRQAPDIVTWLEKKTGPPAKELTTTDEIKELTAKKDVVVVGFYKDKESDAAKAFMEAAQGMDDIEFGLVQDEALAKEHNVEGDNFVLFKKVLLYDSVCLEKILLPAPLLASSQCEFLSSLCILITNVNNRVARTQNVNFFRENKIVCKS